jgi:hypothetical protein
MWAKECGYPIENGLAKAPLSKDGYTHLNGSILVEEVGGIGQICRADVIKPLPPFQNLLERSQDVAAEDCGSCWETP